MLDTKGCRGQLMNIAQRLLSIDRRNEFLIFVFVAACGPLQTHFHARGRIRKLLL